MGNHIIEPHKKRLMKDTIHYDFSKVDSFNKLYNVVISARGTAKSTKIY